MAKMLCRHRRCDRYNRSNESAGNIGSHTSADVLEIAECVANSNETDLTNQLGKIGSKFLIKFVVGRTETRRQRLPDRHAFANER
jgi:hypothetical protein